VNPSRLLLVTVVTSGLLCGCKDPTRFTTHDDHFEGVVLRGSFVRSGFDEGVRMCLTLDSDRLQDKPGVISTSNGWFRQTPLRVIPQIWHDPLSTLNFGVGREKNLVYSATPISQYAERQADALVILSLMSNGTVELRLLRGAPALPDAPPDNSNTQTTPMFAIFPMERRPGSCAF